ncbi:unnamed protein product, partial [Mesorhabditis spiculigera]
MDLTDRRSTFNEYDCNSAIGSPGSVSSQKKTISDKTYVYKKPQGRGKTLQRSVKASSSRSDDLELLPAPSFSSWICDETDAARAHALTLPGSSKGLEIPMDSSQELIPHREVMSPSDPVFDVIISSMTTLLDHDNFSILPRKPIIPSAEHRPKLNLSSKVICFDRPLAPQSGPRIGEPSASTRTHNSMHKSWTEMDSIDAALQTLRINEEPGVASSQNEVQTKSEQKRDLCGIS